MNLVPIFVDEGDSKEGLYAIEYPDEKLNEWDRLIDLWTNVEYVQSYLVENQAHLSSFFFRGKSISQILTEILDEADLLPLLVEEFAVEGFATAGQKLQMLFLPLTRKAVWSPLLFEQTKARIRSDKRYLGILRIYAIRISDNTFVVTGGAIKLVSAMQSHPDTLNELTKLDKVKAWLQANGHNTSEALYYSNEQL